MKKPPFRPWTELVRQARGDRPPAVDLAALLLAARASAPAAPQPAGLLEEFTRVFANPPALWATAACAAAFAWLGYSTWQQFGAWADVALGTLGVAS